MPLIPNRGEQIPLVESMLWPIANCSQLFITDIYILDIMYIYIYICIYIYIKPILQTL